MEELNRVKLLNLDSRSKPPKKKKQNKTKHLNQNTQPPPDSTTKATIGEDDEGDITAKNKACKPQLSSSPYDFFFLSHKTNVRLFFTRKRESKSI